MRLLLVSISLSLLSLCVTGQEKISSLNDSRIPPEVKSRLSSITDVAALEQFTYEIRFSQVDPKSISIINTTKIDLYFADGKIKGEVRITKSQVGFTSTTTTNPVELCYIFCCTQKNSKEEKCTEDYNKFKKWKEDPGCSSSKTTACN